jgi:23S rRNA (cytosine1962-C5)-methyltransferase
VSVYYGEVPSEVTISEHGINYCVSVSSGQKTGYFFDQHENRAIVRRYAQDRSVLDCFCYVGGFAINAAAGGATKVVAVDESGEATRLAALNAEANGQADRIETVTADCFEFLRQRKEEGAEFGLVVLDPPAFVKSGQTLADGLRGYKEINLRAMQLLSPGGVLATFSCSHHLSAEEFLRVLRSAARDARRRFRVAHQLSQAQDHPTLLAMPETAYLKGFVLQLLP